MHDDQYGCAPYVLRTHDYTKLRDKGTHAINQLTQPISHYALPDVNRPYLTEAKGQVCTCTHGHCCVWFLSV